MYRKLKWVYVSVIYEDTKYGISGFVELDRLVNKFGLCFNEVLRIDFDDAKSSTFDYEQLVVRMQISNKTSGAYTPKYSLCACIPACQITFRT